MCIDHQIPSVRIVTCDVRVCCIKCLDCHGETDVFFSHCQVTLIIITNNKLSVHNYRGLLNLVRNVPVCAHIVEFVYSMLPRVLRHGYPLAFYN